MKQSDRRHLRKSAIASPNLEASPSGEYLHDSQTRLRRAPATPVATGDKMKANRRVSAGINRQPSGRFVLRLPSSLHRKIIGIAATDGVSMNQWCLMVLSSAVR
jgi:predicted HicB family RNase H-like nuclease